MGHKLQKSKVPAKKKHDYETFLVTVRDMPVNTSFQVPHVPSNFRLILSACKVLLGKEFTVRKSGESFYRIYRLS